VEYRPMFCRHCTDAPCMAAAPDAVYRREDGLVIVDPEKAQGKRELVDACPYGAIYYNEELDIAQKCTGCAHLVDEGKIPHCVDACATGALIFGEEEELAELIANEVHDFDVEGTGSLVHYLNPFRLFISGEVWDREADLIIEGATATLTAQDGAKLTAQTDGFGDFWFKQLKPGKYTLDIAADGYDGVTGKEIDLDRSLNIGDFPLERL
jgi:tetrathionate reductase subunit B